MLSPWNSINSHEWIHLNLQMIHSLERQFVRIRIHCNHNLKKRRNGCFLHEIESFDETKNRWKATKKRIQRSSSFVSRRTKKKKIRRYASPVEAIVSQWMVVEGQSRDSASRGWVCRMLTFLHNGADCTISGYDLKGSTRGAVGILEQYIKSDQVVREHTKQSVGRQDEGLRKYSPEHRNIATVNFSLWGALPQKFSLFQFGERDFIFSVFFLWIPSRCEIVSVWKLIFYWLFSNSLWSSWVDGKVLNWTPLLSVAC